MRNRTISRIGAVICIVFGTLTGTYTFGHDVQAPCGVIEGVVGQVQALTADRLQFLEIKPQTGIACGTWISVNQGWTKIRHQNGAVIQIGADSFAQFLDFKGDVEFKGDQLILYRGQVLAEAVNGANEFRMVSPIARARVKHGKAIFYSRVDDDEAQLIAIKNTATLENRFSPKPKVLVKAGEVSNLNLKLQRVIPSLPRAVSVAGLKPKLYVFKLGETESSEVLELAYRRQVRKFASELASLNDSGERKKKKNVHEEVTVNRKLASVTKVQDYRRHEPSEMDPVLYDHWVDRMVSGDRAGEKILFPNKIQDVSQKMRLIVTDPEEGTKKRLQKHEQEEKKRLIEELSRIRME